MITEASRRSSERGVAMYKTVVVKYCAKAKEMAEQVEKSPIRWRKKDMSWSRSLPCHRQRGFWCSRKAEPQTTRWITRQMPNSKAIIYQFPIRCPHRKPCQAGVMGLFGHSAMQAACQQITQAASHTPRAGRGRWTRRTPPRASTRRVPPRGSAPARRSPRRQGMSPKGSRN